MPNEAKDAEQPRPVQSASAAFPVACGVTRMFEFFPFGGGGPGVVFINCVWGGKEYTQGARVVGEDGHVYECSGDPKGSWIDRGRP